MKTAVLYAGQGSQVPGMGKSFYEEFSVFRDTIDRAADYVDFDLKKVMFEGPQETLNETRYTQPCLAAFAAGVTNVLRSEGFTADAAAGLSLGEYSALYAAGVFTEEQLIRATAFRGAAMQKAGEGLDTKMCALLGLSDEKAASCAERAALETGKPVYISNYNATGQVVISGLLPAVRRAEELALDAGARKCMELATSSAFHTPFMAEAARSLGPYLEGLQLGEMRMPVIFNATGRELLPGESVRELLKRQVVSPVHMSQSLRYLADHGVTRTVEIGPGHVLTGFVRRTIRGTEGIVLDEADDLKAFLITQHPMEN